MRYLLLENCEICETMKVLYFHSFLKFLNKIVSLIITSARFQIINYCSSIIWNFICIPINRKEIACIVTQVKQKADGVSYRRKINGNISVSI